MTNTFYYTDVEEFSSTFSDRAYYNENTGKVVFETTTGETLTYTINHDIWEDLTESTSQGRYFQKYIRGVCEYHPSQNYLFFLKDQTVKSIPGFDLRAPEGADEVSIKPAAPAVDDDVSEDADNNFRYGVSAYFKDFEQAHILFSYAEALGTQVTLTAFNNLDDDDE